MEHDLLRGLFTHAGDAAEDVVLIVEDRPLHGVHVEGGEHRERHLRPDPVHAEQQQEELAVRRGFKSIKRQGIFAHDQVCVEQHDLAGS